MKKPDPKLQAALGHNLCYNDKLDAFCPIGSAHYVAPEVFALLKALPGDKILADDSHGLVTVDMSTGEKIRIDSSHASAAVAVSDRTIVAMSPDGHITLDCDDNGDVIPGSGGQPEWPAISMTAEQMSPLFLTIPQYALSRNYNNGETASDRDWEGLLYHVNDAYSRLQADAAEQGVFFQPLMARAVVTDTDGTLLYRTPEILIMPPQGLPLDRKISLRMQVRNSTEETVYEIPSFRIRLKIDPMASEVWVRRAARLYVEVSPCFHSWVTESDGLMGVASVATTNRYDMAMVVSLPGNAFALSLKSEGHNISLINKTLACLDKRPIRIGMVSNPFEHGVSVLVDSYAMPSLRVQHNTLVQAFAGTLTPAPDSEVVLNSLNAPHTFTAKSAAASPSAATFANITALLFPGYSPADYMAEGDDDAPGWCAVTRVMFSDGSSSCRLTNGSGPVPVSLNALIVYPHPDATSIQLDVFPARAPDSAKHWTVWLSPDSSGLRAISLADDLAPRPPSSSVSYDPSSLLPARARARPFSGMVAVADAKHPSVITTCTNLGDKITAITPAGAASAAWDYGRTRFYAFTRNEAHLVNVAAGLDKVTSGRMASVGAVARSAIAVTPSGRTCFAGQNGFIYRIDAAKVDVLTKLSDEVDTLAYDVTSHSLMAANSDGSWPIYHLDPASGNVLFTSSSFTPFDTIVESGSHLAVNTQDGVLDIAVAHRHIPPDGIPVSMSFRYADSSSPRPFRLASVGWNISSSSFDGSMTVNRAFLGTRMAPISSYSVCGRIAAPVVMPMAARPASAVSLEIEANVSPDTLIAKPTLSS